ncbi:MAG: hypothetical protein OEW71_00940 [Candidatus Bathyarchaeota archaeon]|nr:hypothetical protein [Candidatus Bathyarchaeota archaeon]
MPKKKSWKERQRERQIRQQRSQEAHRVEREREAERKPRQWPKGKILVGVCLVAVILGAYGVWQYYIQLPPTIGDGTNGNPPPTGSAPDFSLKDIDGTQFSLNGHSGDVIAIHFLAVGCRGQIGSINDHQLKQLKSVCNDYCGDKPVAIVTVAVATCPNPDLAQIRSNYGITWVLGNDYDDGKLNIVDAYVPYGINDGTILLVDKSFDVVEVYTESVAASTLSSKINQLLGA